MHIRAFNQAQHPLGLLIHTYIIPYSTSNLSFYRAFVILLVPLSAYYPPLYIISGRVIDVKRITLQLINASLSCDYGAENVKGWCVHFSQRMVVKLNFRKVTNNAFVYVQRRLVANKFSPHLVRFTIS